MRDTAIRHLAVSDESSLLAAALFESTVQIWDWKKAQQIGEFETILDFGGRRLLLASDGSICVAGSWRRGLAAYSLPDGACLWKRPELVHIQLLTRSASGREVNCGFEKHSLAVIDARTGNTLSTMKNALRVFSSRYSSSELVQAIVSWESTRLKFQRCPSKSLTRRFRQTRCVFQKQILESAALNSILDGNCGTTLAFGLTISRIAFLTITSMAPL